jgi:apolipoprotein D and lipocalin family protein
MAATPLPFRLAPAALSLVLVSCGTAPPLDVAEVDLASFQGPWYELAKLSRAGDARCAGTTFHYRLTSESELDVIVECRDGSLDGSLRRIEALATVNDPRLPAKLTLEAEAFQTEHWIVEADSDYTYAAIGHPSRNHLSILGRLPSLPHAEFSALCERLGNKGFDVSRLERTLQPAGAGSTSYETLRVTSRSE